MSEHAQPTRKTAKSPVKTRAGGVSRWLDRNVGASFLAVAGAGRRRRTLPHAPQRIGISVLGAIGDTLLASAIFSDLKRSLPGCHITLICSVSNRAIAPILTNVDAVLIVPVNRPDRAARQVRDARFDVLIDGNSWLRISAIHAVFADCYTIGFRTGGQARHFAYDAVVDHSPDCHAIDNFRKLVTPLGIKSTSAPEVRFSDADRDAVKTFRTIPGTFGTIVCHAAAGGARGAMREWPDGAWVELAGMLNRQGYAVVLTGGPSDVDRADELVALAARHGIDIVSAAGKLSFPQLAALLAGAAAVVSVNTGTMHLAAAVGARLVALNGPSNNRRWGPLSSRAISLSPKGVDHGYLYLGFEYPPGAPNCMGGISPDDVLAALNSVMAMDNASVITA